MTVGEKIRILRSDLGLTQKKLGELCNIAESTIRRYELGLLNPKFETLNKISKILDVEPVDLISDTMKRRLSYPTSQSVEFGQVVTDIIESNNMDRNKLNLDFNDPECKSEYSLSYIKKFDIRDVENHYLVLNPNNEADNFIYYFIYDILHDHLLPDTDTIEFSVYLDYSYHGYSSELAEKEIIKKNKEIFLNTINQDRHMRNLLLSKYNNLNNLGRSKLLQALFEISNNPDYVIEPSVISDEELPFD